MYVCVCVCVCVYVRARAQSCLTLCDPMDCSPPDSAYTIFQARILEWVAIFSCKGSSQPREQTRVSCVSSFGRLILYHWCHLGSYLGSLLYFIYLLIPGPKLSEEEGKRARVRTNMEWLAKLLLGHGVYHAHSLSIG